VPENLTLKDVAPIIGNPSRNNYFEVSFGGLSGGLSSYLRNRGVGAKFISGSMGLMCYEGSLPGSSLAAVESNNWQGYTESFAHSKIYNNLSLTFYCDKKYKSLKFLEHWMEYCLSGNGTSGYNLNNYQYRVKYPLDPADGYKSNMTRIVKFENDYDKTMTYSFIGLYPQNLSSVPVRYGPNNELTRVTCDFKFDRYIAGKAYSIDFARNSENNLLDNVNDYISNISGVIDDVRSGNVGSLIGRLIN
jgi:hypothetical protein